MGRSKRVRVRTGIWRDATGYTVQARAGSGDTERSSPAIRFELETSPADLKDHIARMESRWLREKALLKVTPAARGTLAADVPIYFQTATLSATLERDRRHELNRWITQFGERRRATLQPAELRRALNTLTLTNGRPMSASYKNKYRTALSNLFTVLDGKSAANPFRDVPRDDEPDAERRDMPTVVVDRILAKMRVRGQKKDSLSRTRARFYVLAYCPVTNAQLCRMSEYDVDLINDAIYPDGRHKGKGTDAQAKAIDADGRAALELFAAAGCWTAQAIAPPSSGSMWKTFTAARDLAIPELETEIAAGTLPADLAVDLARVKDARPYDFRHSFGFIAAQATNIDTAGLLLDQKDRRTTLRYTQGAVPEHLKKARDAIAAQRARDRQRAAAAAPA